MGQIKIICESMAFEMDSFVIDLKETVLFLGSLEEHNKFKRNLRTYGCCKVI